MDYISHHALHSHIPIHHYTNHTAVTIHSLALIASPHLHLIHSHTFKQHSHMHSPRSLVLAPADISERYSSCYLCVWPRTARPWNSEPEPVLWPRPLPGIVYVSALPLIFLFCPLTIAWLILSNKYCCKWIHTPLTSHYSNNISLTQQSITFAHSYIL